jgi:hypothetical protein
MGGFFREKQRRQWRIIPFNHIAIVATVLEDAV